MPPSYKSEVEFSSSHCKKCNTVLFEFLDDARLPCPVCGETARIFSEHITEPLVLRDHMRMKGKHLVKSRPFFEAEVGASFYSKTQEWNHLERIIDRDNNLYIEIIKNPATGEIIKRVEEPLSDHKGHGSAKLK